MTSKERVRAVFAREIPDRVPINYSGNLDINRRITQHFGLAEGNYNGLLNALNVDFRRIEASYIGKRLHDEIPGKSVNPQWGITTRWIENEYGGYWDFCDFPLKDAGEETAASYPMPSPDDYDYGSIKDACMKHEGLALYAGSASMGDIINYTGMMRGMEQTLVDLITDDPAGLMLIDRRLEIQLEVARRTIEAAGGLIDFLWIGEDLGTQNTPIISMELFRKHIRPRHQNYIDMAKSFGLPVMIHSCGSSSWAYSDFIEMGINAVDTLQPEAVNMRPEYLKKTYGDKLIFHGAISTAGPLAYGSVDDVVKNVNEVLDIMMPGGGYCLAPTHRVQDNTPTENLLAMYETAVKKGVYKR